MELYPLTMCYFIERTQKCTKLFFNHYLKGKKWELQLPKGKSYTSNLIFKDTTYTTSFSFNGQTHTIEKPYLIQQENVETFYVIFPSEGKGTKTFPVKFKVLEFTDKLLKLQNTTTNVVNTYFAK